MKFLLWLEGDLEGVLHGRYSVVDINHLDDVDWYLIWILTSRQRSDLRSDLTSHPGVSRDQLTHLEGQEDAAIGWSQLLVQRERPHLN